MDKFKRLLPILMLVSSVKLMKIVSQSRLMSSNLLKNSLATTGQVCRYSLFMTGMVALNAQCISRRTWRTIYYCNLNFRAIFKRPSKKAAIKQKSISSDKHDLHLELVTISQARVQSWSLCAILTCMSSTLAIAVPFAQKIRSPQTHRCIKQ